MFVVIDRNGDNFSIKDTNDGVVETYSSLQIAKILGLGIKIQGFAIKNGKLTYTDLISDTAIAKRKLITGYDTIIFTEEDTKETAHKKIREVKEGAKIYVINNSNITNMDSMFGNCKASEIDLSNFDTSNVIDMKGMFLFCMYLKSLDLSNFDTYKVKDISYMFNYCKSLKFLDLSSFNTSNVIDMSNMFASCEQLTSLDLSSFDTFNVTDMYNMFAGCSGLTTLDVSNFDTSKVNNMGAMFRGCSSLISLDISNFDTSNVTNRSEMFDDCHFKSILPKNW